MTTRRRTILTTFVLGLASNLPGTANAFPTGTITILVGSPPGGAPDKNARALAEKLAQRLVRPVIVENRTGATGMVAAGLVARAPVDGHIFLFTPNTLQTSAHVMPQGTAVKPTDLEPVVAFSRSALVLLAHPSLRVKTVADLVRLAGSRRDLAYGTPGLGSPMHLAGELFKLDTGINLIHVGYKGSGPALTDLLGGHVHVGLFGLTVAAPHIASGRLIPLAVTERYRHPLLPHIPTLMEQGATSVDVPVWSALWAPKGFPAPEVAFLNQEVNAILRSPDMIAKLNQDWEVPLGGSPADLATAANAEFENMGKAIARAKIKAE